MLIALCHAGAELECVDERGRTSLYCASESADYPNAIKFLASKGGSTNTRTSKLSGDRPLDAACRNGHLGNVWALLELGAITNSGFSYENCLLGESC